STNKIVSSASASKKPPPQSCSRAGNVTARIRRTSVAIQPPERAISISKSCSTGRASWNKEAYPPRRRRRRRPCAGDIRPWKTPQSTHTLRSKRIAGPVTGPRAYVGHRPIWSRCSRRDSVTSNRIT
ncbi:MAG: hypothetical protein M1825_006495, partial [Sarcosagium campestre]